MLKRHLNGNFFYSYNSYLGSKISLSVMLLRVTNIIIVFRTTQDS